MRKLYGLQYLRALAAISIIIYHAADRAKVTVFVLESAVDLFFVLSGFLMVAITSAETTPGKFFADRVKRIVPVYWIVTSLMIVGYFIGVFRFLKLEPWHILSSYLFIPSVSPSGGQVFPLLVPGWTLNFEMFFYCLFTLLLFIKPRNLQLPLLSVIIIGLVLIGMVVRPEGAITRSYTDPLMLNFLYGAWLGAWWKRYPMGSVRFGWLMTGAALAMLVLVGVFLQGTTLRMIFFGIPITLLVAGVVGIEQRPGGIPSYPVPQLLGDASYSIYLWHTLIIGLVARAAEILGIPALAMVIIATLASMVGGVIAFWVIEEPILKMMKRRSHRARAPVSARA